MGVTRTSVAVIGAVLIGVAVSGGVVAGLNTAPGAGGNYDMGISFVAFCSEEGFSEDNVIYTDPEENFQGEVDFVAYRTLGGELNTITYQAGQTTYEITSSDTGDDAPPVGPLVLGDGSITSDISASNFCPDGESGVKYSDYSEGEFEEIEVSSD